MFLVACPELVLKDPGTLDECFFDIAALEADGGYYIVRTEDRGYPPFLGVFDGYDRLFRFVVDAYPVVYLEYPVPFGPRDEENRLPGKTDPVFGKKRKVLSQDRANVPAGYVRAVYDVVSRSDSGDMNGSDASAGER
ncbi:MAG: hypothetical protein A4E60_00270 [Syntrophorhabdus sp. PtaB.Bin047]|jgi:hypothetical protein|nr:MAG: hypothetical protein A4E60_00270 [Syntrophorhabdus sp. PtaB.Bin047]